MMKYHLVDEYHNHLQEEVQKGCDAGWLPWGHPTSYREYYLVQVMVVYEGQKGYDDPYPARTLRPQPTRPKSPATEKGSSL